MSVRIDAMERAIRTATLDDYGRLSERFVTAMHGSVRADDPGRGVFEPDRALVLEDGNMVAGTARALTRTLSVPGAVVDAAHVTGVGVAPTHRRRGIMSALMRRQLSQVPESLAVLWAVDSRIYGRFGYEAAAYGHELAVDVPRSGAFAAADEGRLEEMTSCEATKMLPPILDEYQHMRPGISGRGTHHWTRWSADPKEGRDGRTARQFALYRSNDGNPEGYVSWSGKAGFDRHGAAAGIVVDELVGLTESAYRMLWRYVMTMDLATSLTYRFGGVDEPVGQLMAYPRALGPSVRDTLWLRITDVADALSRRRYATDIDTVMEVVDDLLPLNTGRFRLSADPTGVSCTRTDRLPDLSMSVAELSGVYLAGRRLTEFAAAGRVTEHRDGALAAATTAFGWPVAPKSIEVF